MHNMIIAPTLMHSMFTVHPVMDTCGKNVLRQPPQFTHIDCKRTHIQRMFSPDLMPPEVFLKVREMSKILVYGTSNVVPVAPEKCYN